MNCFNRSLIVPLAAAFGMSVFGAGVAGAVNNPGPRDSTGPGVSSGRSGPSSNKDGGNRKDHMLKPLCVKENCKVTPPRLPPRQPQTRAIEGERGSCSLARAIRTVKLYGVDDPEVGRLTNATISLIGTKDGYKVRVEMNRHQRDCRIRRVIQM